ncbi:MAG TPA: DUF3501 family protein [Nitrospiria bacterium]|nr:DUF3501 family protein [Nitrospiria bacterium]
MEKLSLKDILPLTEYERIREDFRKKVIEIKRRRRVVIGDLISLTFENRQTVKFQIQEMMHAEQMREEEKIEEEVETFNDLIPGKRELSATLFIEVEEQQKIREVLDSFKGIDDGRSLYLQIGDEKIFGIFEAGRSTEEKISSVHYVKFPLTDRQAEDFIRGSRPAALIVDHRNYKMATAITPETREELAKDLV